MEHTKMTIGAILLGISTWTGQDWIVALTILYFTLQIGLLIPKYWMGIKRLWNKWLQK